MADYWPPIITGLSGLAGALIGAGASIISQLNTQRAAINNEVNGLKFALAAEIQAYIQMVRLRNQIPSAQQLIEANQRAIAHGRIDASAAVLPKDWLTSVEKNNEAFPVFRNNIDRIGKLGTICGDIVRFYSQATAIRLTLIATDEGKFDHIGPAEVIHIVESEINLWIETEALGRDIIKQLNSR
ncbi:hypothetical protein F9K79_20795 [Ochrobactrum sp. Kaboul]|nr:hypothetical protein F9K79_20795 [Ochrobactrum sp. Kaboul]